MDNIATIICLLVTISIWGMEFLRRVLEGSIHRLVALKAARQIDEMYFVTWNDLSNWYAEIAKRALGFSHAALESWEANRILVIIEKSQNLGNKSGPFKKQMIIQNARDSLPSTFDCYRFYGVGRAVIAGFAAWTLAAASASGNTSMGAVIVLGIILLATLPNLVASLLALLQLSKNG
jgi:hypothetical protein